VTTSKDIARLAGVSRATVSRVLNGSDRTSATARERVQAAIATTGYEPDVAARNLVGHRSHTIALSLFSADSHHAWSEIASLSRYFYHDVLASIEQEAAGAGYDLLFVPHGSGSAADYLRALRARHVVGMISVAPDISDPRIQVVSDAGIPAVYIDTRVQGPCATYVTSDKIDGARQATAHLLDLGHRCIAFAGSHLQRISMEERRLGYQHALAQRGIPVNPALERPSLEGWEALDGYNATVSLLSERRDFTAIVAVSDVIAIGVIRALYEQGLRVPQDVSVTGFDDVMLAGYTTPPLTTVRQDHALMGRCAVARLRAMVEGTGDPLPQIVPTQLVVRQSTGPCTHSGA